LETFTDPELSGKGGGGASDLGKFFLQQIVKQLKNLHVYGFKEKYRFSEHFFIFKPN
jgi:hypothetical protein